MDAKEIVLNFCEAVKQNDVKTLLDFFAEGAVYHNIPLEAVEGRAQIESTLGQFLTPGGETEFKVLAIAAADNKVLTERVDILTMNGKRVEIRVMGTFEIDTQGKISAWRDYFDMAQVASQMA